MKKIAPRFLALVSPSGDGVLEIYDEIGPGFFTEGITPGTVAEELRILERAGAGDLHIYINSPGGDVFAGNAIYNVISRWARGKKIVHVDGVAASMASVIAMAGDEIRIAENGMMMAHEPWGLVVGNADEMRARAGVMEKLAGGIQETYAKRTGLPSEEIKSLMAAETWMNADEAVAKGFADKVESNSDSKLAVVSVAELEVNGRWPILEQFKRCPENVRGLLAKTFGLAARSSIQAKENNKMDPITPVPVDQNVEIKNMFEELMAKQAVQIASLQAAIARPAPSAMDSIAADAAKAPIVTRYHVPANLKGREEQSDNSAKSDKMRRALPMARAACAVMVGHQEGLRPADAAEMIGYPNAAAMIARGAAMSVGDSAAGGSAIPTDVQSGFIDFLEESLTGALSLLPPGSRVRSTLPTIQYPTITAGVSGGWVGENPSTGNPEALATGSLTLTAKKQRIEVLMSRDLLRALSNVDQIVLSKILTRAAQLDELAFVEGTGGSNQPLGIENRVVSANTYAMTASPDFENSHIDLLWLLKRLALSKVPESAGRAFILPEIRKFGLMGYMNPAGNAFPYEQELLAGRLLGKPAAIGTLISTDKVYCFAPAEAIFFEQLAITLESDNTYIDSSGVSHSASGSDQSVIRMWRKLDCAMQHNEAIAVKSAVTWGD